MLLEDGLVRVFLGPVVGCCAVGGFVGGREVCARGAWGVLAGGGVVVGWKVGLHTWIQQLGVFGRDPGSALQCDGLLVDGVYYCVFVLGVAVGVAIRVPLHCTRLLGHPGSRDRHLVAGGVGIGVRYRQRRATASIAVAVALVLSHG